MMFEEYESPTIFVISIEPDERIMGGNHGLNEQGDTWEMSNNNDGNEPQSGQSGFAS